METRAVLWENLREADRQLDLHALLVEIAAWYHNNPGLSHADLELEFRRRNFNTFLYPSTPDVIPGVFVSSVPTTDITPRYVVIFACRPQEYAREEAENAEPNEQVRYEKLKNTGVYCLKPDADDTLYIIPEHA